MKSLLSAVIIMACYFQIMSQISPGGIGTSNLTAWFRADDITPGSATSWTTQYPYGVNAITVSDPQAPYPLLTATPTGAVSNYNNTLQFSENTYAGQNLATVQGFRNESVPDLLDNAYSGDQGSFFSAYYLPEPTSGNGHMLLYNETDDGLQMRNLTSKGRLGIGLLSSNSLYASRDWEEDFKPNVTSYRGNRSTSTSFEAYNKASDISSVVASQSSGIAGLYMGYSPTIQTSAYNGYLHEFIFYNNDLTDLEMNKVHSYLAIKYGITLDNQLGGSYGDYVSTDGTLIWDADLNSGYHNDVIGIGRDDIEGLYQKQSHAFDDSVRVYINNLASTNIDNLGTINANISYLTLGHNGAPLCGTASSNAEKPSSVTTRIAREFKVTKTNFDQDFNLDLKLDTCSSIEGIDLANIRLLVDVNTDFSDAQVLSTADGLVFSVSNGVVTIEGVSDTHIPNNTTRYFTLAYVDVEYTIEGSGNICEGDAAWVLFHLNNPSTVSINYTDGTSNYTVENIQDGDTLFLFPTSTTTYEFYSLAGLIDCCGNGSTQMHSQLVYPKPQVVLTASNTSFCEGEELTLSATGADFYNWLNGVQPDVAFIPTQTETYTVIGENQFGCSDTAEVEVVVNQIPDVMIEAIAENICEGELITLLATGAGTYDWSNGINNGDTFEPSIGSWNYEVTGTTIEGCSQTANVDLIVTPQPIADFEASPLSGIAPVEVEIADYSTNGGSYYWDFGNGLTSNVFGNTSTLFSEGGEYQITLEVTNGICSDIATAYIDVENGEPIINLPNVVTPNNDGANDIYEIQMENIEQISGYILNRWGNVIYSFDSISFQWEPSSDLSEGVYTIVYSAISIQGEELKGQGFIHLIR